MSRESIWRGLKGRGYSDKAAAAIMGNMQAESALRSDNVEDRCPYPDSLYTADVDNGLYSRELFARDAYGYGLCQWTWWSRKADLYDLARERGVSIANEELQLDLLGIELERDFPDVLAALMGDGGLDEMTANFMRRFENPADQSTAAIRYRVGLAQAIYEEMAAPIGPDGPLPPEGEAGASTPAESYWPPRMLCKGMSGPDVCVLQAILTARDYYTAGISGSIDVTTDAAIRLFQERERLDVDGVAGPITWAALVKM